MMKRKVVFFGVFLFTVCLIFSKPVEAVQFQWNVTYEEGRFLLQGEATWDCVYGLNNTVDLVSHGIPNSGFSETKSKDSTTITFKVYDESWACLDEYTEVTYKATFYGGKWNGIECEADDTEISYKSDTVPEWYDVEIRSPAGSTVSGIELITVDYSYPFYFDTSNCLGIDVCGESIFLQCNMPSVGSVTKHVDFSKDASEEKVKIEAKLTCSSVEVEDEKFLCVE